MKTERIVFAEERKQLIVDLINTTGKITVDELCRRFSVSAATIRNDLFELDNRSLLRRTHGGAISINRVGYEPTTSQKATQFLDKKIAIAKAARKFVSPGDIIALDSGSTTFEFAKMLDGFHDLTVVTNDLEIAGYLEKNTQVAVILLGGILRRNFRCAVGQITVDALSGIHVDKVFAAANGVSLKFGLSTPNMDMASYKTRLFEAGDEIYLMADSSKIEKNSFAIFAPINRVTTFITDSGVSDDFVAALEKMNVSVVIAPTNESAAET